MFVEDANHRGRRPILVPGLGLKALVPPIFQGETEAGNSLQPSHAEEPFRVAGNQLKDVPHTSANETEDDKQNNDRNRELDVFELEVHGVSSSHLIDKDSIKERHYFGHQ